MKRLVVILMVFITTVMQTQAQEVQAAKSIDSLGWWNYCIRFIGQDFVTGSFGEKYRVQWDGKIDVNSGFYTMNVMSNPLVAWTGNPASFAKAWSVAGGANKFLGRKNLLHIMKRHFHPKRFTKGSLANKGKIFNPSMTEKMLKKYINATVKKGSCKAKGGKLEFTYEMANPNNSFMQNYKVILNKTGEIVTCFPLK